MRSPATRAFLVTLLMVVPALGLSAQPGMATHQYNFDVTIRVLSPTGQPVPDADVTLWDKHGDMYGGRTDANGEARIEVPDDGEVTVNVAPPFESGLEGTEEKFSWTFTSGNPSTRHEVSLVEQPKITVRVRAVDGTPLPGVKILLEDKEKYTYEGTTGTDGTALVYLWQDGEYRLWADPEPGAGYRRTETVVDYKRPAANDFAIDVALEPMPKLTVRALDAKGAPVAGVKVDLVDWENEKYAGTTGVDGTVTLHVWDTGAYRYTLTPPAATGLTAAEGGIDYVAPATGAEFVHDVTLAGKSFPVVAYVKGGDGKPVDGVRVELAGPTGRTYEGASGQGGVVRFEVTEAGAYRWTATPNAGGDHRPNAGGLTVQAPGSGTAPKYELELGSPTYLTGSLVDPSGKPIPLAWLSITGKGNPVSAMVPSDVNGKYRVELPPGEYAITVTLPDGTVMKLGTHKVEAGKGLDLGKTVAGKPEPGAFRATTGGAAFDQGKVAIWDQSTPFWGAHVYEFGADGKTRITDPIPEKPWQYHHVSFKVGKGEYAVWGAPITKHATTGDFTVDADLVLVKGRLTTGGAPANGGKVIFKHGTPFDDGSRGTAPVGPDGSFEVLLRQGLTYKVSARADVTGPFKFNVDVLTTPNAASHEYHLDLNPAKELRGSVVDAAGKPVEGATVVANRLAKGDKATTDGTGAFTLKLAPGEYRLMVRAPGHHAHSERLELGKDGLKDHRIVLSREGFQLNLTMQKKDDTPIEFSCGPGPEWDGKTSVPDREVRDGWGMKWLHTSIKPEPSFALFKLDEQGRLLHQEVGTSPTDAKYHAKRAGEHPAAGGRGGAAHCVLDQVPAGKYLVVGYGYEKTWPAVYDGFDWGYEPVLHRTSGTIEVTGDTAATLTEVPE